MDKIQDTVNTILRREEASFVGEVISASKRLDEIESQFSICNQFTEDMIIRLALLEDKINPLFERYNYLYTSQSIDSNMSFENLQLKQADAFMSIITSILDIRIDLLKMKINIQNNPGYMETAAKTFVEKIDFYHKLWESIQKNSSELEAVSRDLNAAVSAMNWWQKNMPPWLFGKRNERKKFEKKATDFKIKSLENQRDFQKPLDSALELGETVKKSLLSESKMSLIYWRDELGEHSYYTDDLIIES